MDCATCYCRNPSCGRYGRPGKQAQLRLYDCHGDAPRFYCKACGCLVYARAGTAYWDIRKDEATYRRGATALAEGLSIRATGRLLTLDKDTVCGWLPRLGEHCNGVMSYFFRNLHLNECQLDELWTFIYKKEDHLTPLEHLLGVYGDTWVWIAFSPVFKLVPAWVIGKRTLRDARRLIFRLKSATDSHIPFFTSDDLPHYADALLDAYGVTVTPRRRGKRGRHPLPRKQPPPDLCYAVVVKEHQRGRVVSVTTRIVYGSKKTNRRSSPHFTCQHSHQYLWGGTQQPDRASTLPPNGTEGQCIFQRSQLLGASTDVGVCLLPFRRATSQSASTSATTCTDQRTACDTQKVETGDTCDGGRIYRSRLEHG